MFLFLINFSSYIYVLKNHNTYVLKNHNTGRLKKGIFFTRLEKIFRFLDRICKNLDNIKNCSKDEGIKRYFERHNKTPQII